MVQITLDIPEDLADQARALGLLDQAQLADLLRRAIQRKTAGREETRLEEATSDLAELSEDEVLAMVSAEVHLMRAEKRSKPPLNS